MAFRVKGIENFIADQKYPSAEIAAIKERAKAAAEEFQPGGDAFSGGKIEQVLGSTARVKIYMEQRETNLERYA